MKDTMIIKQLKEQFPKTDIWYDSMIIEDVDYAVRNGFLGITTSPTITPKAIEAESDYWFSLIQKKIKQHPTFNEDEIMWECMYEAAMIRSQKLLPLFKEGEFSGHFCIQANVFDYMNPDKIVNQAKRIHSLGKNFMIKIPVTKAGVQALEEIVFSGHSVMSTGTGSVAQIKQACEAMYRGLKRREELGLSNDAIVLSSAMQLGLPEECYRVYAKENNIDIDPMALQYSSIAVAKKAYELIQTNYPKVNFVLSNFVTKEHWKEFMGGKIMLTIAPKHVLEMEQEENIVSRIDEKVPQEYIDALLEKIPFYSKAYLEDGMEVDDFQYFEGFCRIINHFVLKYENAIRAARKTIMPDPYNRTTYTSSY